MERLHAYIAGMVSDWKAVVASTARMDEIIDRRRDNLLGSSYTDRRSVNASIVVAVDGFRSLENGTLYPYGSRIGLDSRVSLANNTEDLAVLAVNHFAGQPPDPRRSFEALVVLDMAIALAILEKIDPFRRVNSDLQSFVELLFRDIFSSSANDYLLEYQLEKGVIENRRLTLSCRDFGEAKIYFEDRPKGRFHTVLKMIKYYLEKGNDFFVDFYDRRAIRITVVSGDFLEAAYRLEHVLRQYGAVVQDKRQIGNFSSGPSVSNVLKLKILWSSKAYEIQLSSWEDYLDMNVRPGDNNHLVYEANRLNSFLPIRYPTELYKINWDDEEALADLRNYALLRAAIRRY